jgi:hypothetical protein
MPKRLNDGSLLYKYPDTFTDVTWGGRSILPYDPIEFMVKLDGWGYVQLGKSLDNAATDAAGTAPRMVGEGKCLVDGTRRTYFYWGNIVVTP